MYSCRLREDWFNWGQLIYMMRGPHELSAGAPDLVSGSQFRRPRAYFGQRWFVNPSYESFFSDPELWFTSDCYRLRSLGIGFPPISLTEH